MPFGIFKKKKEEFLTEKEIKGLEGQASLQARKTAALKKLSAAKTERSPIRKVIASGAKNLASNIKSSSKGGGFGLSGNNQFLFGGSSPAKPQMMMKKKKKRRSTGRTIIIRG